MGLLDKVKKLVSGNPSKVDDAVDKVADVVDDKTGGKHTEKIESGAEKVKDLVDKLDGETGPEPEEEEPEEQEPPSRLTP